MWEMSSFIVSGCGFGVWGFSELFELILMEGIGDEESM